VLATDWAGSGFRSKTVKLTHLVLTLAAALIPLDLVRSAYGLERARTHDRWILRLLVTSAVVLACQDAVAGAVLGLGVLGWYRDRELRLLLATAGVAAVWMAAPLIPAPARQGVAACWVAITLLEAAVSGYYWGIAHRWWSGDLTLAEQLPLWPLSGFRGQHTLFAAAVAIVLPLGAALHWTLGLVLFVLLVGLSSWLALLAALISLTVLWPILWPFTGGLVLLATVLLIPRFFLARDSWLLNRLPRGDSLDSIKLRWASWWALAVVMMRWRLRTWLIGRGWAEPAGDLMRAWELRGRLIRISPHNDLVEVVYANGLAGVVVIGLLAWTVGTRLVLGDPWSATVVAGLLIAGGSYALHYPTIGLVFWIACAFVAGR
jgi:hypothetical protein